MSSALLLICATFWAVPVAAAPQEDPPSGAFLIPIQVSIDFGPFKASQPREITVGRGDTLGSLAKKWLGKASRHPEIEALNPGVEPKRLQIGATLLVPPEQPVPTEDDWVLFALPQGALAPVLLRPGQPLEFPAPVRLVAVHREAVARFRQDLGSGRPPTLGPRVALSEVTVGGFYSTQDADIVRAEERVTWRGMATAGDVASMDLQVLSGRYDQSGREVVAEQAGTSDGFSFFTIIIASVVLVGLMVFAWMQLAGNRRP